MVHVKQKISYGVHPKKTHVSSLIVYTMKPWFKQYFIQLTTYMYGTFKVQFSWKGFGRKLVACIDHEALSHTVFPHALREIW